jgi:hypothetical protein
VPGAFGPWSPGLESVERVAQRRCLAGLAAVFLGSGHPLIVELRAAERDSDAVARALELLDRVPSLTRRRMLSVFGAVTWPAKAGRATGRDKGSHITDRQPRPDSGDCAAGLTTAVLDKIACLDGGDA